MSVPLPSPSPISPAGGSASAKAIPRSKPTPISVVGQGSPSSPSFTGGAGGSFRNSRLPSSSLSRSLLNDDNWRDRSPVPPPTATTATLNTPTTAKNPSSTNGGSKGPERTVGGFEKREIKSNSSKTVSGLSAGVKDKKDKPQKSQTQGQGEQNPDDLADDAKGLSHVPCRFFKAGACTAGDSCPFSHAAPDSAKREVCQWFLKGNCKFGHKCALAHVRPGEPMSMDRKNKKAAQLEARERSDSVGASTAPPAPSSGAGTGNASGLGESPRPLGIMRGRKNSTSTGEDQIASPVPIRSALSSSMQSPQGGKLPSSPLREPFGPPSGALPNSPNSAGFAQPRGIQGFASSPSRPSPLSASFGASNSVPGPLSLKASSSNPLGSPLRPAVTTAPGFSSSFSHPSLSLAERANNAQGGSNVPLSASFAGDANLNKPKSIWARSDTPEEPLSPRRRPIPRPTKSNQDSSAVFIDDEEEHGEDFLPSSLSDLLTPQERARRMSRRDSQGPEEAFSNSPGGRYGSALWGGASASQGGERLAQSAGPNLGPNGSGFLQSLWSAEGEDARKSQNGINDNGNGGESAELQENGDGLSFGQQSTNTVGQQPKRQTSLLTQQRSPTASNGSSSITSPLSPNRQINNEPPYLIRNLGEQSSSPSSTKVLQEHLPGQSLPGGLASALSRLHMQNHSNSVTAKAPTNTNDNRIEETDDKKLTGHSSAGDGHDEEEGLFDMDG
ncbi:uncharacterized protein L201_002835 [Kwoniella dendrophila CBS 6074]|uniref:C3H1-type domain-containing protein n=1 Tax=Kwoniella dendrophila CBS 6074 TaxID=1295534 RepID=A0AAX4JTN8_9TREE